MPVRSRTLAVAVVVSFVIAIVGLTARAVLSGGRESVNSSQMTPAATAPPQPASRDLLRGRTVVLDPGHNGGNGRAPAIIGRKVDAGGVAKECDTVGSQTNAGYPEHAFTFDVANRAAELLRAAGAAVILTRSDDAGVGPCIDERARIGNEAGADAVVSLHADGGPAEGSGFHVIAPGLAPDSGNAGILDSSARLAHAVRLAFEHHTGEPHADYIADAGLSFRKDLGGLNLSRVPKVFVECANMRNPVDAARVTDEQWRQRAARGIVEGITNFLTVPPS